MAFCALIVPMILFAGPQLVEAAFRLNHPQVQFCSAGFVVRAYVMSQSDIKGNTYTVRVLDLIKDEVDLSRAEGTSFLGSRIKLVIHNSPYNVPLEVKKVYILAGQLQNGKLQMNMGDGIFPSTGNEWKDVTKTQKEGLFFHYRRGCKCQIGHKCYGPKCPQKILGCEYSALERRPLFDVCRMKHQYCEIKEEKGATLCHWKTRETNEFKDCEGNP